MKTPPTPQPPNHKPETLNPQNVGRYSLIDAGVTFKDDRISLNNIITGNWFNMKANENVSGPFGDKPETLSPQP